jgi:hypothetical protein
MRRLLRTLAAVTVTGLFCTPLSATAAPLALGIGFLNSTLTFGGPSFTDHGYDFSPANLYGLDLTEDWGVTLGHETAFDASGGTLVQETPVFDAGGTLIRTDYRYEGGTFRVTFALKHDVTGEVRNGSFIAPISSLLISADEPLAPGTSEVSAYYELGKGRFDAAFAHAFGIPRRTGPGYIDESILILLSGDHTSPELVADNGGGNIEIQPPAAVPETPQSVLAGLGVLAVLLVRFSRTARTIADR